ncbi:conserved hypothetical protein [Nostocoides japonicum T1-X7]|uniref:Uncharacterized protein n=1 Tax=Nostocoides japonicum T1-X7 TaxID=1194083 RepID=A0A077M1Y4_9MICO|nr:hypothetical protein [Tetrasphaera japonica]CCH78180.1 conserved hypothetical protein [Tetrasphaera japonica T1-X7]
MSYRDLPLDMSQMPLSDPKTAADVVDLILDPGSRDAGSFALMICSADDIGVKPVVIDAIPEDLPHQELAATLRSVLDLVAATEGSVVVARGRPGTFLLTDEDRAWHESMIAVCRAAGVRLLGAYVATSSTVRALPAPLDKAS